MSEIHESEIVSTLEDPHAGLRLEHYYLVGATLLESLVACWIPDIGLRALVIEDDELAQACKQYLNRRGARQFTDLGEIYRTAVAEQWPDWAKHVPTEFRS